MRPCIIGITQRLLVQTLPFTLMNGMLAIDIDGATGSSFACRLGIALPSGKSVTTGPGGTAVAIEWLGSRYLLLHIHELALTERGRYRFQLTLPDGEIDLTTLDVDVVAPSTSGPVH